jgi:hypothetical protein
MQFSQLWPGFPAKTHMKEENATVYTNFTYLYHALPEITLHKFLLSNHISDYNPQYL